MDIFFGAAGNLLVAVIIALACLTTSCGMITGSSWYFNKVLKNRVSYERLVVYSTFFSFVVSNVGLTQIIALSLPFLVSIYPVVIVFVVLSLFDRWIGRRGNIYRYAVDATLVFAVIAGLETAGFVIPAVHAFLVAYVPFFSMGMGWFVPALLGAVIGFFVPADGPLARADVSLPDR